MLNATDLTKLSIIGILPGVAKQILRSTPLILKPNRVNHALTLSNA